MLSFSKESETLRKFNDAALFFKKMGESYRLKGNNDRLEGPMLSFLPGTGSSCEPDFELTKNKYDFEEAFLNYAASCSTKSQRVKRENTSELELETLKGIRKVLGSHDCKTDVKENKALLEPSEDKLLLTKKNPNEKKNPEENHKNLEKQDKDVLNKENLPKISKESSNVAKKTENGDKTFGKSKAEKSRDYEENSDFDSEEERKTLVKLKEYLRGYYLDSWVPSWFFLLKF